MDVIVYGKLKRSQRVDHDKWKVTKDGEERLIFSQSVEWYCNSLVEALNSINEKEFLSVNISKSAGGACEIT